MKHLTVEQLHQFFAPDQYSSNYEEAGWVTLTAKANPEYTITLSYVTNGGQDTYADAFDFELVVEKIKSSFLIIDEDGETESIKQIDLEFLDDDWKSEIIANFPTAGTDDTLFDKDSEMKSYTIENDGAPNIKISGECLAFASSKDPYGGHNGRWTELRLYRTAGGKFVCQSAGLTQWQGEVNRYAAQVCETEKEVIEFFEFTRLAKEIYADAGIKTDVVVD